MQKNKVRVLSLASFPLMLFWLAYRSRMLILTSISPGI